MNSAPQNPVFIHLSATAVFTVVARQSECKTKAEVLAVGIAQTNSFFCGKILHRERLIAAIKKSIRNAEEMANLRIVTAIISFDSPEMLSGNANGRVAVGEAVDYDDMAAVLADAKAKMLPQGYYLAQFLPQLIWLNDSEETAKSVIGMTGLTHFRASYHLMAMPNLSLNHIYDIFKDCDVIVDGVIFGVIAGAHYSLIDDDRERGVLFVDIGAKSTSFCIYKQNILIHSACVAIGGDDITQLISSQLAISISEAERLKRYYASLASQEEFKQDFFDVIVDGLPSVVNRDLLTQVMQMGFDRIFEQIDDSLVDCHLPLEFCEAGIVLFGEGSQAKDIVSYLRRRYKLPVHLANDEASRVAITVSKKLHDEALSEVTTFLKERKLRTALGAVLYYFHEESSHQQRIHLGNEVNVGKSSVFHRVLDKMMQTIKKQL